MNETQTIKPVATAATFYPENRHQPLELETRTHVETECAAYHLNRKSQTLRSWFCLGKGPIRPIRINGRLAWKVADIQAVLNGEAI